MKIKKFSVLLFLSFFSAVTFAENISIGLLNGPSSIPASYLIEEKDSFKEASLNFQIFSGADLEIPKLLKGEIDIGILPPNAAAKLWNKSNGNIIVLAVTGNGNIYLLSKNQNVKNLQDLKGKNISCAGLGATPDYMFRYILQQNNFTKKDINLDFSIPAPELAPALISGKTDFILVPEPFASVAKNKNPEVSIILNLSDEYRKIRHDKNADFPMTLLVGNKNKISNLSPETLNAFLKAYEKAVYRTKENPTETGKLVEKHTLGLNAVIAEKAIPGCNFVFSYASSARTEIGNLLKIFYEMNPDSIGGKIPDETFYKK